MTCENIRFMENNLIPGASYRTISSELTSNPFTNAIDLQRSRTWRPSGRFTITDSNKKLYINDGSAVTVDVTTGEYTTPAALAAQIQTDLNAASSNWSVSYSTSTYKFTISRSSGTAILVLSNRTSAIWDDIGFTSQTDSLTSPHAAQSQRNHTSESVLIDLGVPTEVNFIGLIGPIDEVFSIGTSATVTISANNIDIWTSPPFSETLTVTERGVLHFLGFDTARYYRYLLLDIVDKTNPAGPEGLNIGYLYIGGATEVTSSNVARGFTKGLTDDSKRIVSESGAQYFDTRTPFEGFKNAQIQNISAADRLELEAIFREFSVHTPLFVALDPGQQISGPEELTIYANFDGQPAIAHLFLDYYAVSFSMSEAR